MKIKLFSTALLLAITLTCVQAAPDTFITNLLASSNLLHSDYEHVYEVVSTTVPKNLPRDTVIRVDNNTYPLGTSYYVASVFNGKVVDQVDDVEAVANGKIIASTRHDTGTLPFKFMPDPSRSPQTMCDYYPSTNSSTCHVQLVSR